MTARFILNTSGDEFLFNLHAENGEIVLTSERYRSRASALEGIEAVRRAAAHDARYQPGESGLHFVLRADNGEVIGTSETYSGPQAMHGGMRAVREAAASATVEEAEG